MEKTFALIKPEAVAEGNAGRIIARIEEDGFEIKALKMTCLTKCQAENFYEVHREKAFFDGSPGKRSVMQANQIGGF